jgi:two-component system invasion response regulator UvrY
MGQDEKSGVGVLIVDDQASFRGALRDLIGATNGFVLVGEAGSGEDALEVVDTLSPSVVIMDKRMPGMGGIDAARVITGCHPEVLVVLISVEEAPEPEVLRSCGAAAFFRKQELSSAVLNDLWRGNGR